MLSLEENMFATWVAQRYNACSRLDWIVGNALVCKNNEVL